MSDSESPADHIEQKSEPAEQKSEPSPDPSSREAEKRKEALGSQEDSPPAPPPPAPESKEKEDSRSRKEREALGTQPSRVQRFQEEEQRMDADEQFSDSEYRRFQAQGEKPGEGSADIPSRYKTKTTSAEKQARAQARAEARRTRRTMRLQQQAQQDQHYKLSESDDSDDSSIDENYDAVSITESENENLTWRGRMQHVLHDPKFHLLIVVLVSLDALIVIFELLIDVGAFNNVRCEGTNILEQAEDCHYRDRFRCYPHALMIIEGVNISMSPSQTGNTSELCRCGFREGERVCINRLDSTGVNPGFVLHILSLIILTTFLFEIVLKLIAFRLKYFTHKFEVFDGMVVVISWLLDIASIVEEEAFEAASLIIVLRLWRVVRIVNGAVLSSKARSDRHLEETRSEARKIIHALHKAQDKMDDLEAENYQLKTGKKPKKSH